MPLPSSPTRIDLRPPSSNEMSMIVAPASTEFSRSSFTTDDGRSTTSPAAIWSATALGRIEIIGIAPAKLPILAPWRSRYVLFLVLALDVGFLVFGGVEHRFGLLRRHARNRFRRLRLIRARSRVRALVATTTPGATASSSTTAAATTSSAFFLAERELVIPASVRISYGNLENLLVAEERAVQGGICRVFCATPLHQIIEAEVEACMMSELCVFRVSRLG